MKELSIEEKAKRYDEAIERAKEMIKAMTNIGGVAKVDDIQYLFPELKESEDENIRKIIIALVNAYGQGMYKDEMLAWLEKQGNKDEEILVLNHGAIKALKEAHKIKLEKQGEQDMIPLNKVIKFLDEQLVNDKDEVTGEPFINFQNYGAFKETFISYFKRKTLEKQGEQKPIEFDITDAKQMFIKALERVEEQNNKGYKLTDCDKNSWWEDFKTYCGYTEIQKHIEWNILSAKKGDILSDGTIVLIVDSIGEFEGKPIINSWYFADSKKFYGKGTSDCDKWEIDGFRTATKAECNYLLKIMADAGYEWDADKLELREIEQKPAPIVDIEIPFGAKDSELQEVSYHIPKGFNVEINGKRVVIKRVEQKPTNTNIDNSIEEENTNSENL